MRGLPRAQSSGFTLIETLTVIGLFLLLLSAGLVIGLDAISRSALINERDLVVLMLTGARTRALANVNETSHGVRIEADQVIVFEGAPPGTNARTIERNSAIEVSPPDVEIVFEPLTAKVGPSNSIILSENGKEAIIEINTEGRIEW